MIRLIKNTLSFKDRFKPSIQNILKNYGNNKINNIITCRKPIQEILRKTLNILSLNNFENNIQHLEYDKIYHLFMIVILDNNIKILIEKNERINIIIYDKDINKEEIEYINIDLKNNIFNLNEFLFTGLKFMGNDNFFKYNSYGWNCQNFIYNLLLSNNLMKKEYEIFIMQDVKSLFKNMFYLKPISDFLTNTGAIFNYGINKG